MGTTSSAIATFSGTSKYAADLQNVIDHALNVAGIPLTQLENNVTDLTNQTNELTTLQTKFSAIQSALQSLTSANNGGGLAANVSDETVATANVNNTAAVTGGTYNLNVISMGAPTTTISNVSLPIVVDPTASSISSATNYTITYNGLTFSVAPTSNSLNALAQAINTSGAPVSATIINVGPPSAPDYKLSLQSNSLEDANIQLNDGTQDLLTKLTTGSPTTYQVNGQPSSPISTNSNTVTLAPGVTATLQGEGEATVSVAPDSSAAGNALASFVAAYNAAATELGTNHGTGGGALTGSSVVIQLEQALRSITGYNGGGSAVKSLADLGVTFNDTSGQLSFNQAQFSSIVASNPNDVTSFLGSVGNGGFLDTANSILKGLDDSTTGTIQNSINSLQKQITQDNNEITDTQSRLITLNNNLVAQMSAADAAIASIQNQADFFTMLFQTQNALANS